MRALLADVRVLRRDGTQTRARPSRELQPNRVGDSRFNAGGFDARLFVQAEVTRSAVETGGR